MYIKAEQPRALAREFLAHDDVLSLRFEEGAVVVQTARPDAFYARLTDLAASGENRHDSRGDVARRQPAGGLPVPGEVMTAAAPVARAPRTSRRWRHRPLRVFDLSLGQMLWSRRSVFLGDSARRPGAARLSSCAFCRPPLGSDRCRSTARASAAPPSSG